MTASSLELLKLPPGIVKDALRADVTIGTAGTAPDLSIDRGPRVGENGRSKASARESKAMSQMT